MIKNIGILREYFLLQGAQRLVELGFEYYKNLFTAEGTTDDEHMNYTFSVYVIDLFVSEDFDTIKDFLDIVSRKAEEGGTGALFEIIKEQVKFLKEAARDE